MKTRVDASRATSQTGVPVDVRRLAIAEFTTAVGVWGTVVVLAVYAWNEGGPGAVGLMALSRALPSGLGGPLLGGAAARLSRRATLLVTNAARAVIVVGISGLVAGGVALPAIYALMAALGLLDLVYESVSGTLLCEIVADPYSLASANASVSGASNGGFLVGSAGAGFVLAAGSTSSALVALAVVFVVSLVPLCLIAHTDRTPDGRVNARFQSVLAWRDAIRVGGLREAAGWLSLVSVIDGVVDVLVVCAALGYLGAGDAGAGMLQATIGVGTIAGSVVFLSPRRVPRLVAGVVVGSVVLGVSLIAVGAVSHLGAVMVILGLGGLGSAVAEVGAVTLVQRHAPTERRVRMLGAVVSMKAISYALGAALAGALAGRLGARVAFVSTGVAALSAAVAFGVAILLRARSAPSIPHDPLTARWDLAASVAGGRSRSRTAPEMTADGRGRLVIEFRCVV